MNQAGYEALAKLKNNTEMERYFIRLADDLDYDITSQSSLMGVVPFFSGVKSVRNFGILVEELERATTPRNGTNAWLVLRPESERHERDRDDDDEVAMFLKKRDGGDEDEKGVSEKLKRRHRHSRHKRRYDQPTMSAAEKAQVLGINKDSVDAEDDEMQIALGLKEASKGEQEVFDYAAAAQGSQEAVKKTAKAFGMNAASLSEEQKEMAVALGLTEGPKGSTLAHEDEENNQEVKMIDGKQLAAVLGADLGSVSAEEDEMAIALGLKEAPEEG